MSSPTNFIVFGKTVSMSTGPFPAPIWPLLGPRASVPIGSALGHPIALKYPNQIDQDRRWRIAAIALP
jgi:hypothetical protein